MKDLNDPFTNSFNYLKDKLGGRKPRVGIVFGSGLTDLPLNLENVLEIPYSQIPGFPTSTVAGHKGSLAFGNIGKLECAFMQGRFHYYEGYSMKELTLPIKAMCKLGIKTILLTNAAGGIRTDFRPGDFMLILDHINLMGMNPLMGTNANGLRTRFIDMSHAYEPSLIKIAETVASENSIALKRGVYAGMTGPSYETPSEIKMLKLIGVDAVGMSTVPEAIMANALGMKVLGLSYISNLATGVQTKSLSHAEVLETGQKVKPNLAKLIVGILGQLEKKIDEKEKPQIT